MGAWIRMQEEMVVVGTILFDSSNSSSSESIGMLWSPVSGRCERHFRSCYGKFPSMGFF